MERITTIERRAELLARIAQEVVEVACDLVDDDEAVSIAQLAASAIVPITEQRIAAERVRVVEGLVATIKALPHGWVETGVDDGQGHREGFEATEWTRLLAVVEAAREDTT